MRGCYEIRRARKEHQCSYAHYCRIQPGDLYLYAAGPPEADWNSTNEWYVAKACLKHAEREHLHSSETRRQLEVLQEP